MVVSQALKQKEVIEARSLLWDDIEKTVPKLSRSDIETWEAPWRGEGGPGIKAELTQTAGESHPVELQHEWSRMCTSPSCFDCDFALLIRSGVARTRSTGHQKNLFNHLEYKRFDRLDGRHHHMETMVGEQGLDTAH